MRKNHGFNPTMALWLYTRVVSPMIAYGAITWWTKAKLRRVNCWVAFEGLPAISQPRRFHAGNTCGLHSFSIKIHKKYYNCYLSIRQKWKWGPPVKAGQTCGIDTSKPRKGWRVASTGSKQRWEFNLASKDLKVFQAELAVKEHCAGKLLWP